MTLFRKEEIAELSNPGVVSRQLLTPDSVPEARVTVTQVRLEPGAVQPRHVHESSEQFWYAESGEGTLLLADGEEQPIRPGDAARFAPGDIHGARNDGPEEFIYISVTSPPVSFEKAYTNRKKSLR